MRLQIIGRAVSEGAGQVCARSDGETATIEWRWVDGTFNGRIPDNAAPYFSRAPVRGSTSVGEEVQRKDRGRPIRVVLPGCRTQHGAASPSVPQ